MPQSERVVYSGWCADSGEISKKAGTPPGYVNPQTNVWRLASGVWRLASGGVRL